MVLESQLANYGIAGVFISYLIYDRQVILKNFLRELKETIKDMKIVRVQ